MGLGVRRGWTPGWLPGHRSGQRVLRPASVGHRPRAMPSLRRARRGVASPPHRWGGDLRCGTRPPRWGGIPHFVGVRRCLTRRPTGPAITPSPVDGVRSRLTVPPITHGRSPAKMRRRQGPKWIAGRPARRARQRLAPTRWANPFASGTWAPRWGGILLHRGLAVPDPSGPPGPAMTLVACQPVSQSDHRRPGCAVRFPRLWRGRARQRVAPTGIGRRVRRSGSRAPRVGATSPAW